MYCICMWELEWEELYVGSSFLWLVICHLLLSNAACGCRLGPSFAGVAALVLMCVGSSRNLDFVQGVGDNSYTFREGHHVIFLRSGGMHSQTSICWRHTHLSIVLPAKTPGRQLVSGLRFELWINFLEVSGYTSRVSWLSMTWLLSVIQMNCANTGLDLDDLSVFVTPYT